MSRQNDATAKSPLRWNGIVFATALSLLLVTLADVAITQSGLGTNGSVILRLLAPLVAGGLTTLYVGSRGGMHALVGGLISVPIVALLILPGAWAVALLTGVLCALGGAVTEVVRR